MSACPYYSMVECFGDEAALASLRTELATERALREKAEREVERLKKAADDDDAEWRESLQKEYERAEHYRLRAEKAERERDEALRLKDDAVEFSMSVNASAEAEVAKMHKAGARLANIVFNLRQRPETTPYHAAQMKEAQEAWDAAALSPGDKT